MSINVAGVPDNVAQYIRQFYTLSDSRDAFETYADQFDFQASDFEFQIGPIKPIHTREQVLAWRTKAWETINKRTHYVHGIFSTAGEQSVSSASPECMLYGRVEYEKKDGSQAGANWGGHIVFEPSSLASNATPKMKRYHVWVTADP